MTFTGNLLIGQTSVTGTQDALQALDPATGQALQPPYPGASAAQVAQACALAGSAFDALRETSLEQRAHLLEAIAEQIEALGDVLIERAVAESGL
ncbi:aldehyde dehydrogenase family protein, partial [Pseudomonas sp.]|uniref:aldehyde dehydrogenase family protein n=1 Tax=Pseudomonas sp. TaxID=306 RepID=UPI0028B09E9D